MFGAGTTPPVPTRRCLTKLGTRVGRGMARTCVENSDCDRDGWRCGSWSARLLGIQSADVNEMALLAVRTDARFIAWGVVARRIDGIGDRVGRWCVQIGAGGAAEQQQKPRLPRVRPPGRVPEAVVADLVQALR